MPPMSFIFQIGGNVPQMRWEGPAIITKRVMRKEEYQGERKEKNGRERPRKTSSCQDVINKKGHCAQNNTQRHEIPATGRAAGE